MAIKLNRKGVGLSGAERDKENENLTLIEQEFKRVGDAVPIADDAKKIADEAKAAASAAESKSKNVQLQLDNIVLEGDSSPQAAQASVSADGTTYPSLKARLDAEQQAAAAQLADIAVNTSQYGVIGDGLADDYNAFKNAINSGNKRILVKGHIYSANTSEIVITSPIELIGDGETKIEIPLAVRSNNVKISGINFKKTLNVNNNFSGFHIKDCTFYNVTGNGLSLYNNLKITIENIKIENVKAKHCTRNGIILDGAGGPYGQQQGNVIYKNVKISDSEAMYCGYNEDKSITNLWSVGIDIAEAVDAIENFIVENCVANFNYQSGFHMESYSTKKNITLINCSAEGNGILDTVTIGSGFSCVGEGITLVNCSSRNNKLRNYNFFPDTNRVQKNNGELVNCKDDGMVVNYNSELLNNIYNGSNFIVNGGFEIGNSFFDFIFTDYVNMFYKAPNTLRFRTGSGANRSAKVYEETITTLLDGKVSKRFIHGRFMTNLFKLSSSKKYRLTILLDSSQNTALANVGVSLYRWNYSSFTSATANTRASNVYLGGFNYNNPTLTEHYLEFGVGTSIPIVDGFYNLSFSNDADQSTNNINRVYDIDLKEVTS